MLFLTCITGKAAAWTKRNRETGFIVSKKLTAFKKAPERENGSTTSNWQNDVSAR
jgi:hypothetical protein